MSTYRPLLLGMMGLMVSGSLVAAEETTGDKQISYHSQIRPIFQKHCQGCHQPAKPLGGYVMTDFEKLLSGGETGFEAILPGKPDESYLVSQITPAKPGEAAEMPKGRDALAAAEIELIRQWILQGAKNDSPAESGPLVDQEHPPIYELPPVVTSVDFSADGEMIAVSGYHEVLLHKADGSGIVARLVGLAERVESAVFSPDGSKLAVTGGSPARFGEVQIWDVAAKQLTLSLPVTYDTLYGASWSPDSKFVAFGAADNVLRAIDANSGEQVLFQGAHEDWVLSTTWAKDGSHLISVSRDRSMKLTHVKTQRFVDNITSITPGALKGGLISVDRHPTVDHVVVGGADGVPKLYQIYRTKARKIGDDYNLVRKFPAMPGRIFSVKFSQDGKQIVAGSSYQGRGEVRVFETDTGKQICQCQGPEAGVFSVTFSPDGTRVASGGFDGKIRVNDATTGKLLHEFLAVPLN